MSGRSKRIKIGQEHRMSLTDEDKSWIAEQLRTVETTVLTELQKWASSSEARQQTKALWNESLR
jgi:hypothetical protein